MFGWFKRKPKTPPHFTGLNRHGRLRLCKCGGSGDYCCGGTGVRRICRERDCQEFGCSFGICYVPHDEAEAYKAHLARAGER